MDRRWNRIHRKAARERGLNGTIPEGPEEDDGCRARNHLSRWDRSRRGT